MKTTLLRWFMRFHNAVYRLSRGAVGGLLSGAPVLLLTTVGRRSGKTSTTPLLFLPDGERLVVVASYGGNPQDPQWWKNLQANGQGWVEVGPHRWEIRAEPASESEKARLWPLFCRYYPSYEDYQRRTQRVIPLAILTPV